MNEKEIRNEYAFFERNKEVYFDNNSSSLKPKCVVDAVNYYNSYVSTNAGRGVYKLGYFATNAVNDARSTVAHFINAHENEIVFTKNASDSLNLAVFSYVKQVLKKDDEIVLSVLEHHSLYLPLYELAKEVGAKLIYVTLNEHYKLTLENFKKAVTKNTKIVALTYISNITGGKIPAKEMIAYAHKMGATVILDAAQAVPHTKVNVADLDCDFLAFSGYKLGAPTGVGVLYGKYDLLQKMKPLQFGGGMVLDSVEKPVEYREAPYKFEVGTQSTGDIIGLKKAVDFLQEVTLDYVEQKDKELLDYLYQELSKIKGVTIYNHKPDIATIIYNLDGIHAHDAATAYDMYDICIRAGHNCVQPFVHYLNQVSVLRASLYFYNTKEEIDRFIEATKKIVEYFNHF